MKKAVGVFLIVVQFIIPLAILIYCYGRIVWILSKRIDSNLDGGSNTDKFQVARTNTIKTVLIVAIGFVVCWTYSQVLYLMYNFGYDVDFNSTLYLAGIVMVFLNCTINPFIYLIKYKDYQVALKACFCRNVSNLRQKGSCVSNPRLRETSTSDVSNISHI